MATTTSDSCGDESLYPIAVLIDLRNEDVQEILEDPRDQYSESSTVVSSPTGFATTTDSKKSKFVFSGKRDIELLKEVLAIRPYDAQKNDAGRIWNEIAKNLGGKFSGDTARKRFALLNRQHSTADSKNRKRSGTEEDFNERAQLLTDIGEEIKEVGEKKSVKAVAEKEKAESIRNAAMVSLVKTPAGQSDGENPPKKIKTRRTVLELLEYEQTEKFKLQGEEMALKRKQLDLQERRLLLDEQERKDTAEERRQASHERQEMMKMLLDLVKK